MRKREGTGGRGRAMLEMKEKGSERDEGRRGRRKIKRMNHLYLHP